MIRTIHSGRVCFSSDQGIKPVQKVAPGTTLTLDCRDAPTDNSDGMASTRMAPK